MPAPRIAVVEWEDASVLDSETWVDKTQAPTPEASVFKTVGFVLEANRKHVILTCTDGTRLMGARTRIPRGMVRSLTYLTPEH